MPWTEAEQEFVEKHYPRKGYKWCARKLGKQPKTVWAWAKRRDIRFGDLPGWVRASEIARINGDFVGNIIIRADREGVSKRLGRRQLGHRQGAQAVLVPQKWADDLIAEREAKREGDEAREAGYLTTTECERLWNLGKGTVRRGFLGQGFLARYVEGARVVRRSGANGGAYAINPYDAERIRRDLDSMRARARTMVSTKSLAVELGLKQQYLAELGRQEGGELLLYGGRLCMFLTPEQEARVRERVRADLEMPPEGWIAVFDLATETRSSTANILRWATAPTRKLPVRRYRSPRRKQHSWWIPTECADSWRQFRAERDKTPIGSA